MGLNVLNLVKNKIYSTISFNDKALLIFRASVNTYIDSCCYKVFLKPSSNLFVKSGSFNTTEALQNIREATQDEIDWLEACEKEGKFVDKPVKKEFIVGKWYKHSDRYYIKYVKTILSNCKTYNKAYGEVISCGEYESYDYCANTQFEAVMLSNGPLEDLSEIQQFLPDNHIDKLKTGKPYDVTTLIKSEYLKPEELVQGCWYIVKTGTPFEALFKFKKIKSDTILYEGDYYNYTDSSKCYNNPNGLCNIDAIKELKPASNEEVLKYFPYEKFSDESLRVGDWAIGLSDTSLGSIYYNNGAKAFKILSIDSNSSRFTYQHINKQGEIHESSDYNLNLIRKATDGEIPKMSFEEALIECKRRYPIGTKFHSTGKNILVDNICTIVGSNFTEFQSSYYKNKEAIIETSTDGILWYNGVFAEIVEDRCTVSVQFDSDISRYEATSKKHFTPHIVDHVGYLKIRDENYDILASYETKREFTRPKKLEIFIDSPILIKVEPIVELKIKKVSKLTV